jgi:tetratricopeptide (TPR) repeat protein
MRLGLVLALMVAVPVAVSPVPASAQSRDWTACKGKQDNEVIAACSRILDRHGRESPKDRAAASNNRGVAYYHKNDFERAIRDFSEAISQQPKDAVLWINRGDAYRSTNDHDRAIHDYDEAIRLDAKNALAYGGRGTVLNHKGDYDRAIRDFDEAIRLNPKYTVAYNNRGFAYNEKRDFDRAIRDLDEAVRINPNYSVAYSNRGYAYMQKGENERAIADFDEAIRLNPRYVIALNHRGNTYRNLGKADRAIADFDEAIRLEPNRAYLYRNRAGVSIERGDFGKAVRDLDEAIHLDPKYAVAYNERGFAYKQSGEFDRAIADLDEAIRLDPKLAVALSNRGDAYRRRGDADRAIADFSEALRLDPRITPAYTNRGLAYERKGDIESARADYNAALVRPVGRFATARLAVETARERLAALDSASRSQPAPAIAATDPGRRIALVIGNSAYRAVAALPNPQRDAEAVAAALRRTGFSAVTLVNDLGREKFFETLRTFAGEAENADWAVVYFAGHGIEMAGVNYLIPIDARLESDRDVSFETVPLEQVMSAVEGARKMRLVMLDACRDNPFERQMRRTSASRSIGRGLGRVEPEGGTLVVYAAKHGEVALDGTGTNSPFVTALVKNLQTPGVELRKLFDLVRDDVMEATNRRQQPFTYGSLPGRQDFYFVTR